MFTALFLISEGTADIKIRGLPVGGMIYNICLHIYSLMRNNFSEFLVVNSIILSFVVPRIDATFSAIFHKEIDVFGPILSGRLIYGASVSRTMLSSGMKRTAFPNSSS